MLGQTVSYYRILEKLGGGMGLLILDFGFRIGHSFLSARLSPM
jgi:hypothetical protein